MTKDNINPYNSLKTVIITTIIQCNVINFICCDIFLSSSPHMWQCEHTISVVVRYSQFAVFEVENIDRFFFEKW
jgi:hypothetical protein